MILRRATPADSAALAQLGARTFHDTFARDNNPADMAAFLAKTYGETQQRRELEDANLITLIVEEENVAIAFAQLRRAPALTEENAVEIVRFYVDRAWHGRGVAQTMMSEAKRVARELGANAIWLAVWERNPRAIAFYEKCGFRHIGAQPFLLGSDLQTDRAMLARLTSPEGA